MATYHLRVKNDTNPGGRKISAKSHAKYILREDGKSHADYINREGAQRDRDDCVFKGNQLPKWAKGSAQKFFSAAIRYEDRGNSRYKEIELSLPNELTLEQNREIVDKFIANHLSKHYYAYAIHDKEGELSGERHPHVHIMFSERLIDDVERISERPVCKYFRRAAKPLKGEQVASFERRREHGAPKDKKWHEKKYLYELREDFARIQNEVLATNGYSIRVDHRSLAAQRQEAEANGDDFLAKVCQRVPESYIGLMSAHKDDELAEDVKRCREQKQSKQTSLFQTDLKLKATEEAETKFLVSRAENAGLALINSQEYKSANLGEESLRALNQGLLSGLERIKKLKREFVGVLRAEQRAQKEYLPAVDHSFLVDYENKLRQRDNLEHLLTELISPPEKQRENLQAFQAIQRAIKKKVADLSSFLADNNSRFWDTKSKLEEPYRRQNVELVVHGILQYDRGILRELKKTSTDVLRNVETLRDEIAKREKPQTTFTAKEVRDFLYQQYRDLKSQYEQATEKRNRLMFKVISPRRALEIAKKIFLRGELKIFNAPHKTNTGERLQTHYYQTKAKIRSESLCNSDAAQEKIALIAVALLHKNLRTLHEYESAKKLVSSLHRKLKEREKRIRAFNAAYSNRKKNYVYRVIFSESNSTKTSTSSRNELLAIIADALLAEPYAVQLVAYSEGNCLGMKKDWELMSELDKDELIRQKIIREL